MTIMHMVFKPSHGYEDSEEVYFVCPTGEIAKACADQINAFAARLAKRLPETSGFGDIDEEVEAWSKAYDKRESMIAATRWPYGVDLTYELNLAPNIVSVRPINIVARAAKSRSKA